MNRMTDFKQTEAKVNQYAYEAEELWGGSTKDSIV